MRRNDWQERFVLASMGIGLLAVLGASPKPRAVEAVPHDQCWQARVTVKGSALAALYTTERECERFLRAMVEAQCQALAPGAREQCFVEVPENSQCDRVSCTDWKSDDWEDVDDANDHES